MLLVDLNMHVKANPKPVKFWGRGRGRIVVGRGKMFPTIGIDSLRALLSSSFLLILSKLTVRFCIG